MEALFFPINGFDVWVQQHQSNSDPNNFCCIAMASVIICIHFGKEIILVSHILIHIINSNLKAYVEMDHLLIFSLLDPSSLLKKLIIPSCFSCFRIICLKSSWQYIFRAIGSSQIPCYHISTSAKQEEWNFTYSTSLNSCYWQFFIPLILSFLCAPKYQVS